MAVQPIGKAKDTSSITRPNKIIASAKTSSSLAQRDSGAEAASGLLSLQHTVGNQAVKKLIQPKKISVGPSHDKYEQEADRVADQVTHPETSSPAPNATLQRKPLGESITPLVHHQKSLKDDRVSRKPTDTTGDSGGFSASSGFSRQLSRNRSDGSALPNDTRTEMESKFGVNFKPVRIHTGHTANKLTRAINAEAFTTGRDIYMNGGRYQPHTAKGKHLLAHELTHVVQQAAGVQSKTDDLDVGAADSDAGPINRKKILRQFDFLKVRRKNSRTVKKALEQMDMLGRTGSSDPFGHWWMEVGDTDDGWLPKRSYGMWPSKGPDADPLGNGVPGLVNAMGKIPKGRRDSDPLHGEKTDDEFHPVVEVDQDLDYEKIHEEYSKHVRAFSRSYKDKWKWRSRWSTNGQNFQTAMMSKFRMEIPKKKMPMLLNPRVMLSKQAQENMEAAREYQYVQEAFERAMEHGGMPLGEMFTTGGVDAQDFAVAFDVTPEEQESRAELLAQLNPQVTADELLAMARQ